VAGGNGTGANGAAVGRPARAKVNLWLKVVGRRGDGYHLLDSMVAFADLADTVEVAPAGELALEIAGPQAGTLAQESDNLALKAARSLAAKAGVAPRARIRLTKNIPVAAGLGGGSADAAATLRALIELWRLALPAEEVFDLARGLGADVPMCLAGRTWFVGGIGDELRPAPAMPDCGVLLVNPGVPLPTERVFAVRRSSFSVVGPVRGWRDLADFADMLASRGNDLTVPAISLQPRIGDVLARLRTLDGALHAAMSGSGATCFALFPDTARAERAGALLPARWWRHIGTFV
jgi:4-diphosphocytidyl-2-C-methyl-D-erythritol kinase